MRWALLALHLCGCAWFFQLDSFEHDARPQDAADAHGDAAQPVTHCSQMSMLADSFADDRFGFMWPATLNAVTESGGAAVLTLTSQGYWNMDSKYFYDLRDDHVSVSIGDDGAFAPGDQMELAAHAPGDGDGLLFERAGTQLYFRRVERGVAIDNGSVSYDSTMHKYWRFANAGARTTWETSPDGSTWTQQAYADNLAYVGFMHVTITAYRDPSAAQFTMFVRDVNGGTPHGSACKMSRLSDTFSDATYDLNRWGLSYNFNGSLDEGSGVVRLAFIGMVNTNSGLVASTIYDLNEDQLVFELPQLTITPTVNDDQHFYAQLLTQAGGMVAFNWNEDSSNLVYAIKQTPGAGPLIAGTTQYSPGDRWFRFKITTPTLTWDTSSDGTSWTNIANVMATQIPGLDRASVMFNISGNPTMPTLGVVDVDNVNAP
jgi:hypothetical protein